MDNIELTKAQESTIIDFIKRWGVDSPELVAELLDHYYETVLEEMAKGRAFNEVVNSWKTKATFRQLKKIQISYNKGLKKHWRKELWSAVKWTFTGKPLLALIPLCVILFLLVRQGGEIFYWLNLVVGIKAITSCFVGIFVFNLNKRRNRLDGFIRIGRVVGLNGMLSYLFFFNIYGISVAPDITPLPASIFTGFFLITFVLDFVIYRLFTLKEVETSHITNEILKEFKLQK